MHTDQTRLYTVCSHPAFAASIAQRGMYRRYLIPVGQCTEVKAALAYVLAQGETDQVRLMFLHVTPPDGTEAPAHLPGHAERLIAAVETNCQNAALACDSYILAGEVVFSILDTAELLSCDAIVMPCVKRRGWRQYFFADTATKVARRSRGIPVLRIDGDGMLIERH